MDPNLIGGIRVAWRFRIAKIVPLWYQDGRQGDHLEILWTTSPQKPCQFEMKHGGRHRATWRFRTAEIAPFGYQRWTYMAAILKNFKRQLLPTGKSDLGETWWEAFGRHGDSELLKSLRLDIYDGRTAGLFKLLKNDISSQTMLDWAETWWVASERHWGSEFLSWFCPDIQDGRYGHLENLQTKSAPKPSVG